MRAHEILSEEEVSKTYILYFNGKPAAQYDSYAEAEYIGRQIAKKRPNTKYEVKVETCTIDTVEESCKYGRYFCSTDKKWKCRQSPKKSRSLK